MTARLLDGKQLAQTLQTEIAAGAAEFFRTHGTRPGLAAVLVGDNAASQRYVRNKRKACEKVGLDSWLHELPKETTQQQLLDLVAQLNADPKVHGILVQLPLPKQIEESAVIRAVSPLRSPEVWSRASAASSRSGRSIATLPEAPASLVSASGRLEPSP